MTARLSDAAAKTFKLLAVDPDSEVLEMVRSTLAIANFKILTATDVETAHNLFNQTRPQLVLLAQELWNTSAIDLLQRFLEKDPGLDVIVTAPEYSTGSAVRAIQRGACDFLAKPLDTSRLRQKIFSLVAEASSRRRTLELSHELARECQLEGIIGRSPTMLDLFAKIRRLAPHFRTVLLTGATGTGKETVANALHRLSPAGAGPFGVCACSVLSETSSEREFLGYLKGAFSRGIGEKPDVVDVSGEGTLFLDEVADLPWQAQGKLVRLLEKQEVQRASAAPGKRQIRVVGATCRDLSLLTREGKFRQDLYSRFSEVQVRLPRLSERGDDLSMLQRHFLDRYSIRYGREFKGITRRAQTCLSGYSWPGNVRELDGILAHACMLAKSDVVDLQDLPEHIRNQASGGSFKTPDLLPMREVERRHLQYVLSRTSGNKAKAAMVLGISRATVYEMLSRMKEEPVLSTRNKIAGISH